ncbi:GNAT family N-acetyltransferase [Shouchella lonarensis]|uniref:Acetyltransferase (GNAT) domain-containing protein n=1 Tax=Shouchella lonarensis TaxID=1464122 RepID=A0A1G6GTK6_9BACI|nr:GNAT family N-acetyltransferase [Shouchella lonarensis]SDB85327.1 Acetyltransferase (GNAT) domain-containing protein [Shouchella lonarensis]
MKNYQYIYDYKDHQVYRESFNELAEKTFGINFHLWYEKGCWNDRYICHSYVDGDRVVANVSVNKMTVVRAGKEYRALQIGTVMTHPDYRNQGLSKALMKKIDDRYEGQYDFMYLFANDDVLDFYPKFGFTRMHERNDVLDVRNWEKQPTAQVRKLDPEDRKDFALLQTFAEERVPVSSECGIKDGQHLLMFHFLLGFPESIYLIEEEEIIVLYDEVEGTLHLYDVISRQRVDLKKMLPMIISPHTKEIVFHFVPDYLERGLVEKETDGDALFVRSSVPFATTKLLFPVTSHA